MTTVRTFRFEAYTRLAILALIALTVPALSIHELVTTGTIDWFAAGNGRMELPHWLLYPLAWLCLVILLIVAFVPAAKAIRRGYVFQLDGDSIRVHNEWLSRAEIDGGDWVWTGGMRLRTARGAIHFYPRLSSGGPKAIDAFLDASA